MEKNIISGNGEIKIYIDDKEYLVTKASLSGSELRNLAAMDMSYELWQVIPGPSNDKFIETYDIVSMEQEMRFFSGKMTISPGK